MKTVTWVIGAALLLTASINSLAGVEFDVDGATPGKWTMDLDAAKKVAAEKKLPILLDFSGSDWCGWCKVMEENVFTKPEWAAYVTNNLMMVLLDYPSDKSLVPEKYIERNDVLKNEYGVRGYPTFVVLDSDGTTELGRLKSGRDKTPESFQAELKGVLRFSQAEVEKFIAALTPENRETFRSLTDELAKQQQAVKESQKAEAEARKQVQEHSKNILEVEAEIQEFRVSLLDEDQRNQFAELKMQLIEASKKMEDWIKTSPEKNEENMEKYKTMQAEIQELEEKISQY